MSIQSMAQTVSQTVPDEILNQFLAPGHAVLKNILNIWNLRGDGTQSGEDHLRQAIGEEAFAHYHWDTAASNGRVLILMRKFKHPHGVKPPLGFHFPAEWFWCFSQIEEGEDVYTAGHADIVTVPMEIRESLKVLPDLEWMKVKRINFFSHGAGKAKAKHRKPPEGIMFFRFTGGVGLSVAENKK